MKKTLITLLALCGVAAADALNIDFGRQQTQTEGYYNVYVADGFNSVWNAGTAIYVNGATSATSTHNLTLDGRSITMTYTHTTGVSDTSGLGFCPTLTTTEEDGWKNSFSASLLPDGLPSTVADGLTTQGSSDSGSHVLTFTDLAAGTYSLSAFGGFMGDDPMSNVVVTLGNGLTANWSSTSCVNNSWSSATSTSAVSSITMSGDTLDDVNHGYYFTADKITVDESGTLQLTIYGSSGAVSGERQRTPLNYVSLQMVPEPATATLSLLALCGLAARRRRK